MKVRGALLQLIEALNQRVAALVNELRDERAKRMPHEQRVEFTDIELKSSVFLYGHVWEISSRDRNLGQITLAIKW